MTDTNFDSMSDRDFIKKMFADEEFEKELSTETDKELKNVQTTPNTKYLDQRISRSR